MNIWKCTKCNTDICETKTYENISMLDCKCGKNYIEVINLKEIVRYSVLSSNDIRLEACNTNLDGDQYQVTYLVYENNTFKLDAFFDMDLSKNFQEQVDAIVARIEKLLVLT